MVAEDSPDISALLQYWLRQLGHEAQVVADGAAAIEVVVRLRASGIECPLILMDMQMPDVDGYEATQRLRSLGHEGPIVAVTAHALAEDRDRCIRSGCTDFVTKPISKQGLAEILQRHLGSACDPNSQLTGSTRADGPLLS